MKRAAKIYRTRCGWILVALFILGLALGGCADRGEQLAPIPLVTVNDRSFTVAEFNRRYHAVAAESPVSEKADPVIEKEMKLRLLHQITEELILVERAEEIDLSVTDRELEPAIENIRADYPEGEFDKVLVEQAIVYGEWKDLLRMRLLKEKVVREDLERSIALTPEEVAAAYESNFPGSGLQGDQKLDDAKVDEKVVRLVRRQKAQNAYQAWLLDLKARYDVEINATAWNKLIGS